MLRKKVLTLVITILGCLLLPLVFSSCGRTGGIGNVTDEQIEADLKEWDIVSNGIFSDDDGYSFADFNITDRRTDSLDKTDIIYCDVNIKGTQYQTTLNCQLNYKYYNETGWAIEGKSVDKKQSKTEPLLPPPDPIAKLDYLIRFERTDFNVDMSTSALSLTNQELGFPSVIAFSYYTYTSETGIMSGHVRQFFSDDSGWSVPELPKDFVVDSVKMKWEWLVGEYEIYQHNGGAWSAKYGTLKINNVDEETGEISGHIYSDGELEVIGGFEKQYLITDIDFTSEIMNESNSFIIQLSNSVTYDILVTVNIDGTYDVEHLYSDGTSSQFAKLIKK